MQTKLQELTEKIYKEGVQKADQEAEKILSEAKKEAKSIVSAAKKEAESILNQAKKEAEETTSNALNELQLSGKQAMSDLKQKIVDMIEAQTIMPDTRKAFQDKEFVQGLISSIISNWDPKSNDSVDLEVVLPAEQKKEWETFFGSKTGNLLSKGIEVSFNQKIKGGFKVGPKEGGYLISFSDEDFAHFFKAYLRPRLIELLFEKKED